MAEFVMKDLVAKAGREADFYIESAATSTEEIGNPVYPPARRPMITSLQWSASICAICNAFAAMTQKRRYVY